MMDSRSGPPTLLALIADAKAPMFKGLEALCKGLQADAEVIVANSLQEFEAAAGAEKLSQVKGILLGAFVGGDPQVVAALWPRCPAVRWVHSLAAGVDSLVPVLRGLPGVEAVVVTNARGAFSSSLAEYSLAAMLHFNKRVPHIQENKKRKVWEKFIMPELRGMSVGFVGFGDIGQTTARLCRAFGMRILALRRRKGEAPQKCDADETFGIDDSSERLELFSRSDFVVCSLPGTPETRHFCGSLEFATMKETAVFISIGRGVCVDEAALCEALRSGRIAGAALDVFETEPLPESSPVWDAPNTLLTSHNADLTQTYLKDSWDVFSQKLSEFREAPDLLKSTVSLDRGY